MEALLEGEAENIGRKLLETALAGDVPTMRFVVDRLLPRRRSRPVQFDLPPIETREDAQKDSSAVLTAAADGELVLSEAREVMLLIQAHTSFLSTEPPAADMIPGEEASSLNAVKIYRSTPANLLSRLRESSARSNSQGD